MITQEMMNAVTQERMSDIAKLRLERAARVVSEGRPNARVSGLRAPRFHLPSFVVQILKPATAR